ncbi:MAG TPA: ribosome small subunit-dependent GTPase A [Chitinophagaceae bacterium]|nr:ribosome small subunit-dependent GTPase A [Chitinophagaceae bacterium]
MKIIIFEKKYRLLKAIIYKSTGTWYICKAEDGRFWNARIKGKLKIDKEITSSNPIAVGDVVDASIESDFENTLIIHQIHKRKNYLVRSSPHNKNQKNIVASNLDQSILIATLKDPKTSLGFIDRFLVSCEVYHLKAILVFNKKDILVEDEIAYFHYIENIYTQIGYDVYFISAEKNEGIEQFEELLKNKVSLLTGHSGVGKSTLINKIIPDKNLVTQSVSEWSGKGMHTTTSAEMFDVVNLNGQIIDTPGIKELGIVDVSRVELSGYFPEMKSILTHCKFNNCLHINEPSCAIKEAVQKGIVSEERYVSYIKILETIQEKWK